MRYLLILFIFASCTSSKHVSRETARTDSSAVKEVARLTKVLKDTVSAYERQLAALSETGVVFETRTDTVRLPGKIEYYDNGRIKSVEGMLRSANQRVLEEVAEKYNYASTIDSLTTELERKEVKVVTETKTVEKDVKRGLPWFWLCVGLIGGWLARWKIWPWVRAILKL